MTKQQITSYNKLHNVSSVNWQQRFVTQYKSYLNNRDETELMSFNQLGQAMHQAGVPPEIAVEAYAIAKQQLKSAHWPGEDEAVLPLLEVIMTYGMNYRQQIQWQKENGNAQFFQVLEASSHLICITDLQQQICYTNPAFSNVFGQCDGAEEKQISELLTGKAEYREQICQAIAAEKTWQGTLKIHDRNDKAIRLNMNAFPVGLSGRKLSHYVFMAEDISERVILQKRLEQSQRLGILGELASGISHEFNNVMLIIQGFTELIQQEADAEVRHDYANEILAAIDKGKQLNDQIMSFASDRTVATKPQDLKELFGNIRQFIATAVGSDIQLQVQVPDAISVRLSEQHLCQMLTNLCINGRHAIEALQRTEPELTGCIRIECEVGELSPWLTISVGDNGCGMDKKVMKQLFEPFFTTKDVGQGTGLGLSLLQKLVHQYQGEVQVRSAPGKGSAFKMFLPVIVDQSLSPGNPALPGQLLHQWLQVDSESNRDM